MIRPGLAVLLLTPALAGCTVPVNLPSLGGGGTSEPPAVTAPPPSGGIAVPPPPGTARPAPAPVPRAGIQAPVILASAPAPTASPASPAGPGTPSPSGMGGLGGLGARSGPPAAPAPEGAPPAFIPMTTNVSGAWQASDEAAGQQCRLALAAPTRGGLSAAQAEGCTGSDLSRVGAWQSRGSDLTLMDARGAPLILLRQTGPNRYEGTSLARERFAIWR